MFRSWLQQTLLQLYPGHDFDILVPPDAALGDYSTNLAMVIAKKEKRNPNDVAAELCAAITKEGGERIARCEVAGPGFVNVFLADTWLQSQLGKSEIPQEGAGKKVIVEYSAPNIAKPMHVGHLRSTIIGDALANVHAALGYEVIRWNYLGDWGTQFGRFIAGYKKWPEEQSDWAKLYAHANRDISDEDARTEFKKLEVGDDENRKIWERIRTSSIAELQVIYDRLGVAFDINKGEAAYQDALEDVVERLSEAKLATQSEGALIVELSNLPPALIRKSDGTTLYMTRDIASFEDRLESRPDTILYVVANQQALHFQQLFALIDLMKDKDLIEVPVPTRVHVKYGLVVGEGGKKFSSREGNAILLTEVIDEAVRRAGEKNPDAAEVVGIGALKYNDLRQHPHTDITFDWDQMLALNGNSGPYLQYAYARLVGIVSKAGATGDADVAKLVDPAERTLMRHLLDYGDVVSACAHDYALNGLALYLAELAEKANRFYEQVRVSEDDDLDRMAARLELVQAVMAQLKDGLALLGIKVLDRI